MATIPMQAAGAMHGKVNWGGEIGVEKRDWLRIDGTEAIRKAGKENQRSEIGR